MVLGLGGQRAAHDISVDVTTGSDGGHESTVDSLHCGLQIALDDSVELEGLASCQLHRLVSELVADVIHLNPLLRGRYTTRKSATNHERVCRLQALCLSFVADISVILHVSAVEFSQLLVCGGDGARRRVIETFNDSTTQEVGRDLNVFVGDRGRLLGETFNIGHSQCLPQLGFPDLVASLVSIRILVVTEPNIAQPLSAKVGKNSVQIFTGLVVVHPVLLSRPVVAVTESHDGVVDGREVKFSAVLDSIPERSTILGELTLTSGRGDENNILFGGQILDRVVLHRHDGGLEATAPASRTESLGQGLAVAVVGGKEDCQGRAEETLKKLVVGILGFPLLLSTNLGSKVFGQGSAKDRVFAHQLRELAVARQEVLELLLDPFRIQREVRFSLVLVLRVPAVKRPVANIHSLLRFLKNGQRRFMLAEVREIREHNRRSIELVRLVHGLQNLSVRAVDSSRSDIGVSEVHGIQTDVLLSAVSIRRSSLGVRRRVDDEQVNILTRGEDMMDTGVAQIVRPGVRPNKPQGLLSEEGLVCQELASRCGVVDIKMGENLFSNLFGSLGVVDGGSPLSQGALGRIGEEAARAGSFLDLGNEPLSVLLPS